MVSKFKAAFYGIALLFAGKTANAAATHADEVPSLLDNSLIRVSYLASDEYAEIRDDLRKSKVLERLKQFLSPLRLPISLGLVAKQCGFSNMYYQSEDNTISICYEFIAHARRLADDAASHGAPRDLVLYGGLIGVLLHETGHAVFDIMRVPVLGREEDAADQFAAYIALQFKPEIARVAVEGITYLLRPSLQTAALANDLKSMLAADEHGTNPQRLYNFVCMGYGRDAAAFQDLATRAGVPASRLTNCSNEYRQVDTAFRRSVARYVDEERMAMVRKVAWLDLLGYRGPSRTIRLRQPR